MDAGVQIMHLPARYPLWPGSLPCKYSLPAGPESNRPSPLSSLVWPCSLPSHLPTPINTHNKKNRYGTTWYKLTSRFPDVPLTCEHSMEVGTPSSQNHPVSGDLDVLRHYGHVTQQALAAPACESLRGQSLDSFRQSHGFGDGTDSNEIHHLRSSFMTLNAFLMCRGLRVTGPCRSTPSSLSSVCGQSLVHLPGTVEMHDASNTQIHGD